MEKKKIEFYGKVWAQGTSLVITIPYIPAVRMKIKAGQIVKSTLEVV